jgi:hypothetical protein
MVLLEAFLKGRCDIATPCDRIESVDDVESEYDFVVVGAGSAGSIVAGRLSENDKFKVTLFLITCLKGDLPKDHHHHRPIIPLCGVGTTCSLLPFSSISRHFHGHSFF